MCTALVESATLTNIGHRAPAELDIIITLYSTNIHLGTYPISVECRSSLENQFNYSSDEIFKVPNMPGKLETMSSLCHDLKAAKLHEDKKIYMNILYQASDQRQHLPLS